MKLLLKLLMLSSALFAAPSVSFGYESSLPERVSPSAQAVAHYIQEKASPDAISIIADKPRGTLHVFYGRTYFASSPMLYGRLRKDDFPGGSMEASYTLAIPLSQKMVTPAGMFPLTKQLNDPTYGTTLDFAQYKDYRLAIHPVYLGSPAERREERLQTAAASDNAISFGCINVPADFFSNYLKPLKIGAGSTLYILPNDETTFAKYFPLISPP